MGLRATVVKTYKVEYGNKGGFNYGNDFLVALVEHFEIDAYTGGEYNSLSAIWEFDKEGFEEMVEQLKQMSQADFGGLCAELGFSSDYLFENGYTREYVLEVFTGWLEETPEDSAWVRIGWL